jgi:hypothetical protein
LQRYTLKQKKIDTALAVFNRTLIGGRKPPELTAGRQAAHATLSQENTSSGLPKENQVEEESRGGKTLEQ